jgi:hypothetical protein
MTWQNIRAHRAQCGLTAIQATQLEWDIRLSPYRMTERASPG